VHVGDVAARIRAGRAAFDAILLDVDNGPDPLAHEHNATLYSLEGVREARRALRPGGVFAVSVWYAWTALMVPLDLEIREGSVWILVLAKRAGVDIYDSSRVAFANMNHGPMDAVLKGWIGTHIPSLAGHVVVRFFVFLLPFFLLGSAYYVCRRSWTTALLAAGALHLLFVHITLTVMLGRSDATLLCAAAIGFALTHALLVTRHRNWTNRRYVALQVALGACGAVMFLINWRIFPTIGVMVLLTLAKQVAESSHRLWRTAFAAIGLYLGGFALVWLPTLLFELHGDFQLFYRRSLGFFTQASGWGAHPGTKFQLFPAEIHESRVALLLLFAALVLAALYHLRRERAALHRSVVIGPGRAAEPGVTEAVVHVPLVGVDQNRVRLGSFLEPLFGFFVARIAVGMEFQRELPVRALDLLFRRRPGDAQDLVVVTFAHARVATFTMAGRSSRSPTL